MILLSTAYLGNIQYYSKLLGAEEAVIEAHENYQKQSSRNRCEILCANGVVPLVIPVEKRSGEKTRITEVRIDNTAPWQKQHWNSIVSAYRNSPYFDHFEERFVPFYQKKYTFLFDFNQLMQHTVLQCLNIELPVRYTEKYVENLPDGTDFRNSISRKKRLFREDPAFRVIPYYQVFSEKFDFFENLSIIDLLFCEGMQAVPLLKESHVSF